MKLFEKVEKEWAVVRRFRDPVAESIERLKKLKENSQKSTSSSASVNSSPSPQKKGKIPSGARTTSGNHGRSNSRPEARVRVSFALSAPDDEDEHRDDWQHMSIEELEEATLEIRRQMWELHSTGETD